MEKEIKCDHTKADIYIRLNPKRALYWCPECGAICGADIKNPIFKWTVTKRQEKLCC